MKSVLLSRLSPAIGQQLLKFAGLHGVDPGQDVGEIFNGIDVVCFARSHEREMYRGSAATCIGAAKQTVLSHQDEIFDSLLGHVIINGRQIHPISEIVIAAIIEQEDRYGFVRGAVMNGPSQSGTTRGSMTEVR